MKKTNLTRQGVRNLDPKQTNQRGNAPIPCFPNLHEFRSGVCRICGTPDRNWKDNPC